MEYRDHAIDWHTATPDFPVLISVQSGLQRVALRGNAGGDQLLLRDASFTDVRRPWGGNLAACTVARVVRGHTVEFWF